MMTDQSAGRRRGRGPAADLPTVVICSGLGAEHVARSELFAWLRRADRIGAAIGAVCTGAYLLARAGLLDGHRCTIHWENLPAFREEFPDIDGAAPICSRSIATG